MNKRKIFVLIGLSMIFSNYCSFKPNDNTIYNEFILKAQTADKMWIRPDFWICKFNDSGILTGIKVNNDMKMKWNYNTAEINNVVQNFAELDKSNNNIFSKLTDIIRNMTITGEERINLISAWGIDWQTQNHKSGGKLLMEANALIYKYSTIQNELWKIFKSSR